MSVVGSGFAADRDVRAGLPQLPARGVFAATALFGENWYALGAKEIKCLTRVIEQKPHRFPAETHVMLPLLNRRAILWELTGQSLTPFDVIDFDDEASLLYSAKREGYYNLMKTEEREARSVILGLIARIQNGTDLPLTVTASTRAGAVKNSKRGGTATNSGCAAPGKREEAKTACERGTMDIARGRLDDAITEYAAAIRLDPKCTAAYYYRACAYATCGRLAEAVADVTEVIRLDPKNARAFYLRSRLYKLDGKSARAKDDLGKARDLGYKGDGCPGSTTFDNHADGGGFPTKGAENRRGSGGVEITGRGKRDSASARRTPG
jgi:tetratricopeptide (TPR) repeat protein